MVSETPSPAYEMGAPLNLYYQKFGEMDGTGRPAEIHGQAISELQGQSLSELEHTRMPIEVDAAHHPDHQLRFRS